MKFTSPLIENVAPETLSRLVHRTVHPVTEAQDTMREVARTELFRRISAHQKLQVRSHRKFTPAKMAVQESAVTVGA